MGKVHRAVMSRIAGPVQAVFLDTPAGFELNADQISERALQYFKQRLNLDLVVASFKAATTATPIQVKKALRKLRRANYIFAGPGSPTYAVRNWQGTPLLAAMSSRLAVGAHLVLASAAAIAVGRYVLPVYEIYKVGADPHWVEGLDLLGPYGLELAIVPHWNNSEGGAHDTRYCFMGEPRMRFLKGSLPDSAVILGIDEYTACIIDLDGGECRVMGAGQVTVWHGGREAIFPDGAAFELDQLRGVNSADFSTEMAYGPLLGWNEYPDESEDDDVAGEESFIELLVQTRAQLRAAEQWALADEIRERLAELGVVLEDGQAETTWRKT